MVVPLIPVAVIGLLALITLTTGAVLLAPYLRDVVTGESTPVEMEKQNTIQDILDNPDLTEEEKVELILAIIGKQDWMHDITMIVFLVAIAYVLTSYLKK